MIRNLRYVLLGQGLRRAGVVSAWEAREHVAAVRRCLQENDLDITASFVAKEAALAVSKAGDKDGGIEPLDDFATVFAQSPNQEVAQRGSFLQQVAAKLRQGDDGKKTGDLVAAKYVTHGL